MDILQDPLPVLLKNHHSHEKPAKTKELTAQRKLGDMVTQCGILDRILEQKKEISGKLVKS